MRVIIIMVFVLGLANLATAGDGSGEAADVIDIPEIAQCLAPGAELSGADGGCLDQASCCKYCSKGKPCGDSCIARDKTCHQPPGCACAGLDDGGGQPDI